MLIALLNISQKKMSAWSLYCKFALLLLIISVVLIMLDGPRGSLRRLRSQLAEDGCPESQVILAKHLLEEKCGKNFVIVYMLTLNFKNEAKIALVVYAPLVE